MRGGPLLPSRYARSATKRPLSVRPFRARPRNASAREERRGRCPPGPSLPSCLPRDARAHRAIELAPDYYDAWDNLKWIQLTLGHEAPAVEAWIHAEELDSGDGEAVERAYRAGGLERLHRESIKSQLEHRESGRYHSPYDLVLEYTALGEIEPAMAWLERSFAERETDMVDLAVDPRLDPLRGEPRFREILVEIGIPGNATGARPQRFAP